MVYPSLIGSSFTTLRVWVCGFAGLGVGTLRLPKELKRRYGAGHLHFITCSCYRRLPLFGSARSRNLFVRVLGQVRDRYGFALVGYVVMPEHIHLLIGEPVTGTPPLLCKCSSSGSRGNSAKKGATRLGCATAVALSRRR